MSAAVVTPTPSLAPKARAGTLEPVDSVRENGTRRLLYARRSSRTGVVRYIADFRPYSDVGGRRVALKRAKERWATTSLKEAETLYDTLERTLRRRRAQLGDAGLAYDPLLGPMGVYHLRRLNLLQTPRSTLRRHGSALKNLVRLLGNVHLSAVRVPHLEEYVAARTDEGAAPNTVRNELNTLSGLYTRAIAVEVADRNPVEAMPKRPGTTITEAEYLTRGELARLLDAAVEEDDIVQAARARLRAHREGEARIDCSTEAGRRLLADTVALARRFPYMEAVLTTFAYSGGRHVEVFGLDAADVDFVEGWVRFRQNAHRPLKRRRHNRALRMHPPVRLVLARYREQTGHRDGLLFPNARGGLITGFRSQLRRCLERAGFAAERRLGYHSLRHTFATIALQTLVPHKTGEAMPTPDYVRKLLGHRNADLVETVYGHVADEPELEREFGCEWLRRFPASRLATGAMSGRSDTRGEGDRRGRLRLVA